MRNEGFRVKMTEGTLRWQQLHKEIAEDNLQLTKAWDELTEVSDALSLFAYP